MNNTLLIGFGYKARHGKGTACDAIMAARGDKFDVRRYSFADQLRAEVAGRELELCTKFGIPFDPNAPKDAMYPNGKQRALLQWWGTEYRRSQDPNYWIKALRKRILEDKPQIALIDDMRFKNEHLFVTIMGGVPVKVTRHGYTLPDPQMAMHQSELDLDGASFPYEITVQDGELEQLQRDAVTVFDMIVKSLEPEHTDFSVEAMKPIGEEVPVT